MNNETRTVLQRLKGVFAVCAVLDSAVFILIFLLHRYGITSSMYTGNLWILGIILLVLTTAFCVAIPILARSIYVSRTLKERRFSLEGYIRIQIRLVFLSLGGALFAALAYLFLVPKLHLYASMIAALYGVYSAIPSKKKIQGEINYFSTKCR